MSANNWVWLTVVLILGAVGVWLGMERRWAGPLYCIEQPGTLWNGLGPLPAGYRPECPESRSYRQEVRSGQSRVERYRADGWRPTELLNRLTQAGYRQLTDDPIAPGNYAAFLTRQGQLLQYLATFQEGQTVVTLSGRP
jgi:hypothetical protein